MESPQPETRPNKRQKREEYRANLTTGRDANTARLPKKRFFRQRAHTNPFSDHDVV